MKGGTVFLLLVCLVAVGIIAVDKFYVSKLEGEFIRLEKQRIVTSNKLATAKIVYENLNHVRDLVFKNMDFPGPEDDVPHESIFFEFLTSCVNDLKIKMISVKPIRPDTIDRVTTFGYDMEVEGDFFKFGELCAKFENSRRIISLETYEVSLVEDDKRSRSRSTVKKINVKMRVNTYRVKKY